MASCATAELGLLEAPSWGIVLVSENEDVAAVMREYFRQLGKKGGAKRGESKRRGDADYYSRIAKMRKPKVKLETTTEPQTEPVEAA